MISAKDYKKKQILFLFSKDGDKLSFSNDNIIVKDKDNKIKHQSTCYRLFILFVVGDITITTGLIKRSKKYGFTICLMTTGMKLYQTIGGSMEGNILLHKRQYNYSGETIAKKIIINKLCNQRDTINKIRIKTDTAFNTMEKIEAYIERLDSNTFSPQEMLGIEGSAARIYFKEIFSTANWQGRQPRIKRDYINSTLDIGYTILFNLVDSLLGIYDFDKYYGVLHTCFYMRKSLVCDLMEPLRPIIDLRIRSAINYGQCKEEDFELIHNRYLLKWKLSPKYTKFLMEPILERQEDIFLFIQSYYRSFMKQKIDSNYSAFKAVR